VEELLVERGVEVNQVTVYRWAQRFTPPLIDATRFGRHPRAGSLPAATLKRPADSSGGR
jgi:transposase-like protein